LSSLTKAFRQRFASMAYKCFATLQRLSF
jgi:hypothetical protein